MCYVIHEFTILCDAGWFVYFITFPIFIVHNSTSIHICSHMRVHILRMKLLGELFFFIKKKKSKTKLNVTAGGSRVTTFWLIQSDLKIVLLFTRLWSQSRSHTQKDGSARFNQFQKLTCPLLSQLNTKKNLEVC